MDGPYYSLDYHWLLCLWMLEHHAKNPCKNTGSGQFFIFKNVCLNICFNLMPGVPLEFISDRDGCDVPLIVSRICEYLKINGIHQEGLFRVNGNMKVVERLKTAFDKCKL